jgi:hypothetical protein
MFYFRNIQADVPYYFILLSVLFAEQLWKNCRIFQAFLSRFKSGFSAGHCADKNFLFQKSV